MKKIVSIILSFVLVFAFCCEGFALEANPDTSDWFVWDMPDERQALGTAIDASNHLDAPAGKYGFTRTKGEYIEFVDQSGATREARFWGTNISTVSMFDDYEKLEELAMRIARSGYNLVRFHAPDLNTDGNNIFGMKNGANTTRKIDPDQLDKLFYLFSELKERGVYIYLDLMAYRSVLPGDGLTSTNGGMAADACFDPEMIELQKEYAAQLLGTVNHYTGLALKDDPALAFLQIHNENGFTELIKGSFRNVDAYTQPYCAELLNSLFNTWLKEKYKSDSALKSAWFKWGKTGLKDGESLTNGTVLFDYAYANNTEYSDGRKNDHNRFVYDTQKKMYTEMIDYLRNMGVRCMITGTSLGLGAQNAVTAALCDEVTDFVDMHAYNSHPTNWFGAGSIFNGFGSSAGRGVNLFWILGHYRMEKPYIIGEYQSCIPNPYGAETEPMMAVIASFQNWYPLNYNLRSDDKVRDSLYCAFQTYNSPARTAVQPSSAIVYHRHDVREAEKALEIPITRDNIINSKYEDWSKSKTGKIQFGLYTDYVKARYKIYETDAAYNGADKSVYNSVSKEVVNRVNNNDSIVNNQIVWERDNALMKVTTDYSNMLMGNPSKASYESDAMKIKVQNEAATVTLVSLDDKILKNSEHMLLTAVARERNTDMEMDEEDASHMISSGHAPILTEAVSADVTIKTTAPIAVYALDSSGRKKQRVDVNAVSGGYSFSPSARYETLYYEIEKINNGVVYAESDIFTGEYTISGYAKNGSDSVYVMVKSPNGYTYQSFSVKSDSTGYFERTAVLPEVAERGEYTVTAEFSKDAADSDSFRFEREKLNTPDNFVEGRKYVKYGDGVVIVDNGGTLGSAVSVKGNKNIAETTEDGYSITFDNSVYPYEFNTMCTNISAEFAETAYVGFDIDRGEGKGKVVLSFRRGFDTLRLDVSKYVEAKAGWQTVRVPLADFSACRDFDFSEGEYYIGVAFDRQSTATVKIKNMVLGNQLEEDARYYYKGDDVITLVENGGLGAGFVVYADRNTSSVATATRDYTEDGIKCLKLAFAGENSAVKLGNPSLKKFEKLDGSKKYILAMRLKAVGETKNVALVKTKADFMGAMENVISAGIYFADTDGWYNVFIPVSQNLSDVYAIGLSSGELDMFIESAYLVPEDEVQFSKQTSERIFKVDTVVLQHGVFERDYEKYGELNGYPSVTIKSKIGKHGQNALSLVCLGKQGFAFEPEDLGITQENYAQKYLAFDIRNVDSQLGSVIIGRMGDEKYESVNVGYNTTGWQTVFVPFSAFTTLSALPWDETNTVYIAMGDATWWRTYELDNIVVGSFVDGVFEEKSTLDEAGNAKIELSNSMNASFEFVQQGENIFAVKKDGVFKGAVTVDPATAVVQGGSTAELTLWNATAQKGDTVEWYRWRSDGSLAPVEEKLDVIIK